MAVEAFLPPSDSKQTIEKKVKPKPSTKELTTIEFPGKPMPDSDLKPEPTLKKKIKRKTAKAKRNSVKITKPKKESILIITEKPQAAMKIAQSLGSADKFSDNRVPYYELQRDNQNIIVASAVGHLFNLTYIKGQKGWPIFKTEWYPSYEKKRAAFTKNYFMVLKKLSKRAKEIIIASVDYNEQTPIMDNGKFKLTKIGELVENIKAGKKEISDYLVPSFNKKGIIKWNKLKNAISHKIKEELYEISLEYGRKVKLTSSHNIFKLRANKITLTKTTDLKVGENILCPSFLPTPKTPIKNISFLDLAKKERKIDLYVAGKDIAKILQKRTINKTRKNYHLNEKRLILTQKGIDIIKKTRIRAGYSTQQIASLAKISQSSVSLWENGLNNPTKSNFSKYLTTLKINSDFIRNPLYCKIAESSFSNVLKNNYIKQYKNFSNLNQATMPLHKLTKNEISSINEGIIYGSKNKRNSLPVKLPITKEIVRLMGYYLAEGDTNNNYRIRFSLGLEGHGHEKKIIEEIKEFCDKYGIESHKYLHSKIKHQIINIDNAVLALFFKYMLKFGKNAKEKTIPSIVFHLPDKLKIEFLRAFFLGDGSLSERNITFNTASEKLALDMSYLLLQLGIVAGVSKSVHKSSKGGEIMWHVTISNFHDLKKCKNIWKDHHKAGKIKKVNQSKKQKERYGNLIPLKIKSIRKVKSSTKKVYDLSVTGENFIAGTGGVCCHNTDYDVEGEVIGWNVLRFIAQRETAKRMKYSTLTKPELIKSFENPMPTLDWGQAYAGETRHKIDWLYGINLSRALMSAIKTTGSFKLLSIGRVQGPALKIIVDRDKEIRNFKPVPFWQVFAKSNGIELKHPKDIFDKSKLDAFKNIKEADATTTKKEESIMPPHPFDLTTLQREMHKWHRISPSNTLKIAQALYLDGVISYPRTSSQKIPKEINPKQILKKLSNKFPEVKKATRKNPVEGKKSDPAHPSIYPTGEFKPNLTDDEEKLYKLIVKRFISAFSPDAKTANKRIILTADNGKKFTTSGMKVLEKGWTNIYPTQIEEKDIPDLNGRVKIDEIKNLEKQTQPPKRYTAASLVSLLEKKGLGTKSTRSMIVDILFDRGYLDGKSIEATPLGNKLIEALEKYSPIIIDENLTRNLEEKMEEILDTKITSKTTKQIQELFEKKESETVEKVERLITDISKEFKLKEKEIGKKLLEGTEQLIKIQKENSTIMPCPICKKGNLAIRYSKKTRKNFVACDAYPNCKTTYNLPPNSVVKKTNKVNEEGLPILVALRKGKRPWEFPFDPHWKDKQHTQQ